MRDTVGHGTKHDELIQAGTKQGRRRGMGGLVPFVGPAMVVSVAYIDPGNFATNIEGGARYGYTLLWVVLMANIVAMLFQSLSARLGIVTGKNLAELCRAHFPRPLVWVMWVVSELAAMATDLAEFLGGAIGLSLLFHIPLMAGMVVTGVATYVLLMLEQRGFRRLEIIIGSLVGVVGVCYLLEVFIAPVDWAAAGFGLVSPRLPDGFALTIAMAIIGATVMPHALFLHSELTARRMPPRGDIERRRLVKYSDIEVVVALGVAGLINIAMVLMAAAAFHPGHADVAKIETAYRTLLPLLGGAAATVFLVSLVASGLSSSVVGTLAGQMIMQGFVDFRIPIWVRRLATMLPAFVVVWMGFDVTRALVMSQVALSVALPVPMVALLWFSTRRQLMGPACGRILLAAAILAAVVVLALNVALLLNTAGVPLPGMKP
ncbi:Nramp family divalent metal transporter [Pinirhizobacter sp.]|jgi:manganese transport protein|uniref:Nramp family divalent metal transporter n=1 Tax=Pinirhizobacter sp. TaxID=2950432 RepID=UPI002F424EE6